MTRPRHEPGTPFRPWFKPRAALPVTFDYAAGTEKPLPWPSPPCLRWGVGLGMTALAVAVALVLGLYRDELKALALLPGLLAIVGLPLTVAGAFRARGRIPLADVFAGVVLNGFLLAATLALVYALVYGL